ncbi:mechanosensitive ion channel family protein [Thiomicrorhabdus heinhorstiae]|uniref:Mechanosensitive ion channel family protein n=1 Tax=Thiomicrorhabdus heinhorstiae TaxID=2748010 RepID=A0ABS0BSM6_9GAMM|nr:mechanosensitive ion channel family protein [Thiomicrorhabdus heinhorstiae]MBF6056800.1 mechanosensitive ion channel family protein [Thiomicrorhabdus heinhorstiae]
MEQWLAQIWSDLVTLFGGQVWMLIVSGILLLTALIDAIQRRVLRILHQQLLKRNRIWLDSIVDAARSPASFFIWVNGTVLALTSLLLQLNVYTDLIPYIQSFKSTILTLSFGWFVIRLVQRLEKHLKRVARADDNLDEVTVEALAKIIKLLAFILTGLFFLNAFGVSLTGLLAFGGVGGIAVGFAAKDLLGNVLGGLMLYLDKPFTVGEWIRSPDKNIEGTVEEIGWRMTTVRTFDKRPLYIPNGIFANISIENPSRMTNRRIKETMGIRYSDVGKIAAIIADVKQMLIDHPDIDDKQTLIVNFNQFGPSSLDFFIYTFTKTTEWILFHEIKQDVLLKVSEIVELHGAEMAFPTRSLHLESWPENFPISTVRQSESKQS